MGELTGMSIVGLKMSSAIFFKFWKILKFVVWERVKQHLLCRLQCFQFRQG